jgi:hypothetical protein
MAKLKPDPIARCDLIEYLDDHSDFSFEIKTLNELIKLGFKCEHGGTYEDPATQKPREYDIRATRHIKGATHRTKDRLLRLAIECKNLRSNFPLLISCLPRRSEEAFHNLSISYPQTETTQSLVPKIAAMISHARLYRLKNTGSLYPVGESVGKSCDQVGRGMNNEISFGDSGIYDKWSQALSSAHDLISLIFYDGQRIDKQVVSLVFPLVVVPNDRLWCVKYDVSGNRISDRCSFFVNRKYFYSLPSGKKTFVVSHLEFVTLNGLLELANYLCSENAKKFYSTSKK